MEFSDDDEALAALQGAGEAASDDDDDEDEASAGPKAAGGTKPGHKKFVFVEALGYGVLRHEQHDNLPRKFSSLEAAQDAIAELGSYTKNPKEKRGKAVYQINDGARKGETGKLRSYKVFCLDRATTSEGKRSNDKCQHQFEIQEALTLRGDKFVVDTHFIVCEACRPGSMRPGWGTKLEPVEHKHTEDDVWVQKARGAGKEAVEFVHHYVALGKKPKDIKSFLEVEQEKRAAEKKEKLPCTAQQVDWLYRKSQSQLFKGGKPQAAAYGAEDYLEFVRNPWAPREDNGERRGG